MKWIITTYARISIELLRKKRDKLNRQYAEALLWFPQGMSFASLPLGIAVPFCKLVSEMHTVNSSLRAWVRFLNGIKRKNH